MPTKSELREYYKDRRNALSEIDINLASQSLCEQLIQHPKIKGASMIGAYLPVQKEVDLRPAIIELLAHKKQLFVPILHPWHKTFWFAPLASETYKNKFGIEEPCFAPKDLMAPWELEVILLPLLAADKAGHRLGMGQGYYDRSLAFKDRQSAPYLIGCAYACQITSEIPLDTHDIQLDELIIASI